MHLRYFGTKPPHAWAGTPVAEQVDLGSLDHVLEFFHGTAREAAVAYPKNANVAAALALAGGGFETTHVTLIADPKASGNSHRYELNSPLATVSVEIANKASGGNAKTSAGHRLFGADAKFATGLGQWRSEGERDERPEHNRPAPMASFLSGGEWEEGTGAEITSIFPADGSVNRVLRGASREDGLRGDRTGQSRTGRSGMASAETA